MNPQP